MSCEGCGQDVATQRVRGMHLCRPCLGGMVWAYNKPLAQSRRTERVQVNLVGLQPVEAVLVRTLVAVLADPAMSPTRERLVRGEITLAIEGGDVTFIDTDQVAIEIANRLAAVALPEGANAR